MNTPFIRMYGTGLLLAGLLLAQPVVAQETTREPVQGLPSSERHMQPDAAMLALATSLQNVLSGQTPWEQLHTHLTATDTDLNLIVANHGTGNPGEMNEGKAIRDGVFATLAELKGKVNKVELTDVLVRDANRGLKGYVFTLKLAGPEQQAGTLRLLAVELGTGYKFLMVEN